MKRKVFLSAALVLLLLAAALLVHFRAQNGLVSDTFFAMGSYVDQTLYGGGREDAAREAAIAIRDLESRISWRYERNAIDLLNKGFSRPVLIDGETRSILETALAVSEKSGGAFDPTILPLSSLWNFDGSPRLPEASDIEEALSLVDYSQLTVSGSGVSLPYGMSIDLGAAGKGAACDCAFEVYKKYGVKAAVIAVGGSVGLLGEKPGGGPWRVSVRDPWGDGSIGVLSLPEGFVSTSGSYEKTFTQDGKTYHHILDPKTGYPAQSGLASVTVVSGGGALSDCLSTACFVLGYEESLPLLEAFSAQGVFIFENKEVLCTPGLAEAFTPVV